MKVTTCIKLFWVAIVMFNTYVAMAQNQAITEPQMFYRHRTQFGGNINSSGLGGINFKFGWHKTGLKKNMLDIEFARTRHPKETRIYGQAESPSRYTFGRMNMLFNLRTGLGQTIAITERPYKNALSLNFNYTLGLSTAILKPSYLDVFYRNDDGIGGYVLSEQFNPNNPQHTQNNIIGNSPFFTGSSNTSFEFGAYGKASLSVEWGEFTEEFHTLEAGLVLDVYPSQLELMAYQPKTMLMLNLYLCYTYGWNK